jgi:hypothetical protein
MNPNHIQKTKNLYKISNYWIYYSSQAQREYLPPELKYLPEFDVAEISRTLNLEKVTVFCLGVIFYRVFLLMDEKEFFEENGSFRNLEKIESKEIK